MSSRARYSVRCASATRRAVHGVGDATLQRAQRFLLRLALVDLALVVGAARGVVTDLGDGDDVQRVVQLAVAAGVEPMPFLRSRRCFDRRDAGVAGEVMPRRRTGSRRRRGRARSPPPPGRRRRCRAATCASRATATAMRRFDGRAPRVSRRITSSSSSSAWCFAFGGDSVVGMDRSRAALGPVWPTKSQLDRLV